jgi:hypothetical protein
MSQTLLELVERAQHNEEIRTTLLQATPEQLAARGLMLAQQAVLISNLLLTRPFQLEDLPDWDTRYGHAFSWADLRVQPVPWTPFAVPLAQARIALITTAGIYRRQDQPFETLDEERGDPSYRVIPLETLPEDLRVRHHLALVRPGAGGNINHLLFCCA